MKEFAGKHVLLIIENCSVPFDKRVWREAEALKELGFKVSVISPKGFKTDIDRFSVIDGIEIYRYKLPINVYSKIGYILEYMNSIIFSFYFFARIHRKSKINIIHVGNPPDIFFLLGWLCKIMDIKFIYDQHDLSPESYAVKFNGFNSLIFKTLRFMECLSYRTADHIIATNESLKKNALKRGKAQIDNVTVVRNGPDINFRTNNENNVINKNRDTYIVSYLGIMGFADGVDNIIHAADHIINALKRKDISIILIGYGDQFENLRELTGQLRLEEHITFTNRIPDEQVKKILLSTDVCLAPDPFNGLNEFHTMNKIAEYMSYSKPIVSFDLYETRVTAGDAAVYIKNNDPVEFGEAIISLLDNRELREKMGKIGKERLESMFTWEHSKIALANAYRKVINTK